ncbi:MAG: molybdopterin molybdotransferase MoeA [Lacipirellulaceae bacterium]
MISVDEAHQLLAQEVASLAPRTIELGNLLNLRLAESIVSDVDSPPFAKSLFDGYAINVSDATTQRRVVEEVTAGNVPKSTIGTGEVIRVMTGTQLPVGANAVVKREECKNDGAAVSESVVLPDQLPEAGSGVMQRGASFARDEEVLAAGKVLGPLDIALLAEIGRTSASAVPTPKVTVLPTGNELVEPGEPLDAGQIRNSNGPMLLASLERAGFAGDQLSIGRDDPADLEAKFTAGMQADVLLVTGGVSAGVLDLAPGLLKGMGVREVFHKVRMKPGKPVWFGVTEGGESRTYVFGLPGNPVSALVAFHLFALPLLRTLSGEPFAPPQQHRGALTDAFTHKGKRQTYFPSRVEAKGERELPLVTPLDWRGSADLATLTRAQGLAVFEPGDYVTEAGAEVELLTL